MMNSRSLTRLFCCLLAILVVMPEGALAFDTGHHADLTRNALAREGFRGMAIETVVLQNWITDYYGNFPVKFPRVKEYKAELEKLHFDNLFDAQQIRSYWWRLATNTRYAVQLAAKKGKSDPVAVLTVMGVSLHAVQDFYSHSNWVELFGSRTNTFETKTWFDVENAGGIPIPLKLETGWFENEIFDKQPPRTRKHDQLNKDHYRRDGWPEAYVFAYAATRQWIQAVRGWVEEVNPGFWDREVKAYVPCVADAEALIRDSDIAYLMSLWIVGPFHYGHWKGPGSGDTGYFLNQVNRWGAKPESRFKEEFTERVRFAELATQLYTARIPADLPLILPFRLDERAVIIRTLEAAQLDLGPGPDILAKVRLGAQASGSQEFIEVSLPSFLGIGEWPWQTIWFVPSTVETIEVRYDLFQQRGFTEEKMDVFPVSDKRELEFRFLPRTHALSGDVTGVHDTNATAVTMTGEGIDKNKARIRFYITERPLR